MIAADASILLLTPGFPENEKDTTCLPWLQNFIRNLRRQYPSCTIRVVSFQYPRKEKRYNWLGTEVTSLGGRNKGGWMKFRLRWKAAGVIEKRYAEKPFSAILSFWYGECARSAERFARRKKILHYCWIAGQDAKEDNPYPATVGMEGRRLIAVSDFIQEYTEQCHGVRPQQVIPFGTDTSLYAAGCPEKDIDLLGAGSLIPLKQYPVFIETVRAVKQQLPAVRAVLIGKGPDEKMLRQLIAENQLEDTITLTGELPYPEVLRYMQRAKVFLHPSAYEGFGCVCTEALFAGAFVIRFTRPMKKEMQNSFAAASIEEMISKAVELLRQHNTGVPVNEYPVEETVQKAAALLGL